MGIYLDNAATRAMRPEVVEAMMPYFAEQYGNPSSLHEFGLKAKKALQEARGEVARRLECKPHEVYFTSGGTEADNWAIQGYLRANPDKGSHIITSAVEHHAILHTCQYLEKQGYTVTYLPVDENGVVSVERLRAAIRPETALISIMYANNEIGTVMPIPQIGALAKLHGIAFHCDAVQAVGHFRIAPEELGITMLSASAHKIGGPKGMGFLYVKDGTKMEPLLYGGAQEKRLRAGTENVAGAVGLAKAMEVVYEKMKENEVHLRDLSQHLVRRVMREIPYVKLNGTADFTNGGRHRGIVSLSFAYVEASALLVYLDMQGIHCSGGSACTSASGAPSHVIQALGLPPTLVNGTVRISLDENNTIQEMDEVAAALREIVARLREMSEEYKRLQRRRR